LLVELNGQRAKLAEDEHYKNCASHIDKSKSDP